MATLAEIENELAKEGVLAQPGKGGVLVSQVDGGFLLQNVNKDGEVRRLATSQIEAIIRAFPKLAATELERLLVRNTETTRRAIMLEERRKSVIFSDFMSLDDGRAMPPVGSVDARNADKIPRLYSALDMSDPKRPTLAVWGSEFAVPGNRLDEAMLLIDIDPGEAQAIRNGQDPRVVLNGKTVSNARVLYFDPNRVITGDSRLNHHLKSLESLEGWIRFTVGTLKVNILGNIFLHAEDDFVDPPAVRLTDQSATVERPKPGRLPPGKPIQRFFLSLNLAPSFVNGVLDDLKPVKDSLVELFIHQMGAKDQKTIKSKLDNVIKELRKALAHAFKHK